MKVTPRLGWSVLACVVGCGLAACSTTSQADDDEMPGPDESSATGGSGTGDSGAPDAGDAAGDADDSSSDSGSGGGTATGTGGGSAGPRGACKRGLAYGYHTHADMSADAPGIAWWYNWAPQPDEGVKDGFYETLDVEYVPMIGRKNFEVADSIAKIPANSRYLLSFNEPNFGSQADLTPQEAADLWPQVEEIADAHELTLVSPAVNFCGGDCNGTNPFDYLDEFFAACQGCRVDKVAFHIYVDCKADGNHAQWLIDHVNTYKSRFSQPLWLTEFACTNASGPEMQRDFLLDAVAFLEAEPRIERYAWFAGRFADEGALKYVGLLGADGELTALGQAYIEAPKNPACGE